MKASPNSKTVSLANLLLKLHYEQTTGVVTIKDERRAVRVYLKSGHVVYADGIDKEAQLLKQIAAKRRLDPSKIQELNKVKEKDPHSFGKTLTRQKIITQAVWGKFLILKVKHILSAAVKMKNPDLGFSSAELRIPPENYVDLNTAQLLLDTIRGTKEPEDFWDEEVLFSHSPGAEDTVEHIPLNLSEKTVYSLLDGRKTVDAIASETDLATDGVHRILFLLLSLGLIVSVPHGAAGEDSVDYEEMVNLYLDLLAILEGNLRQEVGKEIDNIISRSLDKLSAQSKTLIGDLDLARDARETTVKDIAERLVSQGSGAEGRLFLQSSFNKLVFLLIMNMKDILGVNLTEKTIKEMMNILEYVEKYRQDTELMNYVGGNLKDYLQQIKS
ncbi:MAG: DUF4388 domain-containing protein [Deltaproteobacteria bacterium]|nr:DUF4388 domain-containing protein [Deltaproteobacteria bacterium]